MKREIKVFVTTQHETKSLSFKIGYDKNGLDLNELELMYEFMLIGHHNRIPVDVLADILVKYDCHTYLIKECGKPIQYTFVINKVKAYAD